MFCKISQISNAEYGISSLYDSMTACCFIRKAKFLKRISPETQLFNQLVKNHEIYVSYTHGGYDVVQEKI